MTATAFAFDPALDIFDDVDAHTPLRPQLRLINGGAAAHGHGRAVHGVVLPASQASVEVYRRRRFLALIATSALVIAIAWAAGLSITSFGYQASSALADQMPAVHVVLPGDSYAAIAADLGVADPVAAGELLRSANGGSELRVGQRIVVDIATLQVAD